MSYAIAEFSEFVGLPDVYNFLSKQKVIVLGIRKVNLCRYKPFPAYKTRRLLECIYIKIKQTDMVTGSSCLLVKIYK